MGDGLNRDQLIAIMMAEKDAELHGRGAVHVLAWPDEEVRSAKAVEFLGRDDVGELVVEHTRIETYPDQIGDRMAVSKIFEKHGPELVEREDAGRFSLTVNPGVMSKVPYKQRALVADILTHWVRANIDRVPWPHVSGEQIYISGTHPDIRFGWSLWQCIPNTIRLIGPNARVVQISYARPDNLEELRIARLQTALRAKIPKLLDAAGRTRRSILVIEERDTHLSSPLHVSRALRIGAGGDQLPDAIYMINTTMGNPLACIIYEAGNWSQDGDDPFRWHTFTDTRSSQLNMMPVNWA
jgi:hypothetical protein